MTSISRKYGLAAATRGETMKKKVYYGGLSLNADGELRATPAMQDIPEGYRQDIQDIEETLVAYDDTTGDVQVIDGQMVVVEEEATIIKPRYQLNFNDAKFSATIETIVESARQQGCIVTGSIRVIDLETLKRWRIRVDNGTCIYEEPVLLWPDGTKGPL